MPARGLEAKNSNALDKVLLTASIVGALLLGYLLYDDHWMNRILITTVETGRPIGEVLFVKNDVRRRMSQSLTWYDTRENEVLYERDTVFTGNDSELEFKIGEGEQITLQADSTVVLQTQNNELIFDLRMGSLSANTGNRTTLKIIHEGQITEIKAEKNANPIQIQKNKSGALKVTSQTGDLEVSVGQLKTVTKVKKNEEIQIDKSQKSKKRAIFANFTSHDVNDTVWVEAPQKFIKLTWQSSQPETKIKLQIAKSTQFNTNQMLHDQPVVSNEFNWPIEQEGLYAYRLVTNEGEELASVTQIMRVFERKPIVLVAPQLDEHYFEQLTMKENEKRPLRFRWQKNNGVKNYKIEIAKDLNFESKAYEKEEKGDNIILSLASGVYYWRVLSLNPANVKLASEVRRLTVGRIEREEIPLRMHGPERPPTKFNAKKAPQPLNTPDKIVLEFSEGVDVRSPASVEASLLNPPELNWTKTEEATNYKVEIDSDPAFSKPNLYRNILENKFVWKAVQPGNHYWRVSAVNDAGIESVPSPAKSIHVLVEKPKLKIQPLADEKTFNPDEMSKEKLTVLTWSSLPYAHNYKVIEDNISRTVSEESVAVSVLPGKSKKVQVAALNKAGKVISDFSMHEYNFKRDLAMKPPEMMLPADETTLVAFEANQIDPIVFVWKSMRGAKNYEVQFSSEKSFNKILMTKDVKTNKLILKEKLSEGVIYWRIRAFYEKQTTEWSLPRSFEMQTAISR